MHQASGAGKRKSPKRFSLLTFVLIGGTGRRTSERARRAKYPRRPRRVASERVCSSVPRRGAPRGGKRARAAALRMFRPLHRMPSPRLHPQRKRPPLQARRRRPGTAPRTCSRTPPRAAAPPRDEIPLRNNPARPAAPSPPARPAGTSPPPAPDMSLRPAPEASSHSVPDASRRPDCGTGRRGGARSGAGGPSKTAEAGTGSAIPAAWRRRLASAL